MRKDMYDKAEAIQLKIRRLEAAKRGIEGNRLQLTGTDPETGLPVEIDPDISEKIASSALAIINLEIRNLNNEFLML